MKEKGPDWVPSLSSKKVNYCGSPPCDEAVFKVTDIVVDHAVESRKTEAAATTPCPVTRRAEALLLTRFTGNLADTCFNEVSLV